MSLSRHSLSAWLVASLVVVAAAAHCRAATPITHPDLKFRAVIPDGFEPDPADADPNMLFSFVRPPADPFASRTVIRITRMRQSMTSGTRMEGKAPKGVQLHEATENWKGYQIPASKMVGDVDRVRAVLFRAKVPLTPEAITVHVGGAETDEPEIAALFRSVLASLVLCHR